MRASTRAIIADLVISSHETDEHPAVSNRDKAELRRYLTHVMVNDVTLHKHLELLEHFKVRLWNTLDFSTVQCIVNIGLDHLSNQELATLALDALALQILYEKIDEKTPEAWTPAVKAEGLKLIAYQDSEAYQKEDEGPGAAM